MDFDLTEDQRLLKDSVEKLLAADYDFDKRRAYSRERGNFSKAMWGKFAEMGLMGLPFSEDDGGFGAGAVEVMIVMQAFGKALVLEPYVPSVVLGGGALRHAGSTDQKAAYLPGLIGGETTMALATTERYSRYDLYDVETSARREGSGWVLSGVKYAVPNGAAADTLVVSARVAGAQRDKGGIGLFLVAGDAKGVARKGSPAQDMTGVGEIALDKVSLGAESVLGDPEGGLDTLDRLAADAIAAHAAEAVGLMDDLVASTVDYLKTRRQFGVAIGAFQALQHRASDMFVALEQARSMMLLAAMTETMDDAGERAAMASAAKAQIGRCGRFVGQQAIQLHGGIGMTMEYKAGHSFKRLAMIDTLFGDADHHVARVADRGGLAA